MSFKNLPRTSFFVLLLAGCSHPGGPTTGPPAADGKADDHTETPAEPENEAPRWHDRDRTPDERSGLYFEDAYLQCFDGETEIGIYADGEFLEPWGGMGEVRLTAGHRVEVRNADGQFLTFDENLVATTDGAGNDTFQVFYLDSYGLELVVNLHYDHELGYLAGHWSEPEWGSETYLDGFSGRRDVAEEMNCYDYTYGDL